MRSLPSFLRQIDDAARNWRDELQAELPGFRDRVCQIRIPAGEGGFHLRAAGATVARLFDRGRAAGREILRTFDWDRHRLLRYVILMELLEENLALLSERFAAYRSWLETERSALARSGEGWERQWLDRAEGATSELLAHAPVALRAGAERPQPEPALRIAPRI